MIWTGVVSPVVLTYEDGRAAPERYDSGDTLPETDEWIRLCVWGVEGRGQTSTKLDDGPAQAPRLHNPNWVSRS